MIKDSFIKFSYLIFPRRCDLCGEVIYPNIIRCDECSSLYKITGEECNLCGCEKDKCICTKKKNIKEYKSIIAPYYFEGGIIKAIHRFKLDGYKELSKAFAIEMESVIKDKYKDIDFDFITYVPMTKKRARKRGYNQSQLLANELSNFLNVPIVDAIKKTYETKSQRKSSAKERLVNLHGSFDINVPYSEIENKNILLIDDVKTTGSTLNECAYVLNGYDANNVYCAVVAVVKRENKYDKSNSLGY